MIHNNKQAILCDVHQNIACLRQFIGLWACGPEVGRRLGSFQSDHAAVKCLVGVTVFGFNYFLFTLLNMVPNRKCDASDGDASKTRKTIPTETKVEIIKLSLLTSPRLIKTHLPVQLVPQSFWEQNCRMIYVARNPKDIMVSYYHFDRMNKIQPDPGAWEEYIDKFNTGQLVFGSWYDHVQGWWEKSRSYSRICYVFFEDMREDPAREISRLCSFLGLSPNETQKKEVLRKTGFEEMKKSMADALSNNDEFDESVSPFMRKGIVGDWKNHFTVAQNEAFNEEYRKKMKESDLKFKMEI
uniref:Sulfotransferase n=1 Tax=Scleropages formosus TaxID=113540 RepID=A0A8C9WP79_SCLFO